MTQMITKEDIKNLAHLARIEIGEDEAESLSFEIDSILGYVSQIENMKIREVTELPKLRNVMREDIVTHKPREYTEDLLLNAPSREGDFLKVKKILG